MKDGRKVVVCGGGVIGVCSAYFLAKKGLDVTIVEQSSVACAASGKAGGFLALDWCRGPSDPLARLSFRLHEELAQHLGHKYEYRPVTTLSVQVSQPKAGAQKKRPTVKGLPDWIDGHVKASGEIGTSKTTAQVHPRLFTEALLQEAQEKHGVSLKIGRVEGVETASSGDALKVRSVVVGSEKIPADVVVFALGPWTSQLKLLGSIIRVSGLKANSVVLRPTKTEHPISPHMLFLRFKSSTGSLSEPEVYPRSSGQVYVCGMSSDGDVPKDPNDIHPDEGAPEYLQAVASSVSSQLEEAELVTAQACYLPCTDDGNPVIGKLPGLEGAYVATGHSCWGILNAPATGLVVSELITEGMNKTSVDISSFDPGRFASSPALAS